MSNKGRILYPFADEWPVSCDFQCHKDRDPPSNMPGTDLAAPQGTEILSSIKETATASGWYQRTGGGLSGWIVGPTEKVYIAHMSKMLVSEGDTVQPGQVVGLVGSTGNSTGPHLHISAYIINDNNVWARGDPESFWYAPSEQPETLPETGVPMKPGTLLTIHAQSKAGNFDRFLQEAKPWYVKLMDWGTDWPYPDTRVILRMFEDDDVTSGRAGMGAAGAQEAFNKWAPEWSKRAHYAWAIEDVANEPHPMYDTEFNKNLDEYTCEMSRLFAQEGWRYAGNLFSVGWPDIGMAHQFKASMTQLASAGHLWGPHEYNNPVMDVTGTDGKYYWTGRIGNTIQELRAAGATVPAIYIGECGLDCGVSTPECEQPPGVGVVPTKGWQYIRNDADWYMPQLIWYDDLLAWGVANMGVSIITACIYNSGSYSPWETFEINDPLMDLLIERWQTYRGDRPEVETVPPAVPPQKPPPEPTEPAEPTDEVTALTLLDDAIEQLTESMDLAEQSLAKSQEALDLLNQLKGEVT